ncbi:hypothetical protein TanjilG_29327 [Lupinus angustifolius]|uniref:Uncharacterized protein n=1 Tax=Lupinus angustifolius TaxID=3871 RepID=A0A1J7GG83_LUPAN|nr:hypothetical protein TanjilG_29327 [Lupinus angustifolius]
MEGLDQQGKHGMRDDLKYLKDDMKLGLDQIAYSEGKPSSSSIRLDQIDLGRLDHDSLDKEIGQTSQSRPNCPTSMNLIGIQAYDGSSLVQLGGHFSIKKMNVINNLIQGNHRLVYDAFANLVQKHQALCLCLLIFVVLFL